MNKQKTSSKIPKTLQGILWSCSVEKLDLERDKNYIIHQVLAYGDLEQINWLLKIYGKEEIKKEFLSAPQNAYSPTSFIFAKDIVLGLKDISLDKERYVQNILGGVNRPPKKVLSKT